MKIFWEFGKRCSCMWNLYSASLRNFLWWLLTYCSCFISDVSVVHILYNNEEFNRIDLQKKLRILRKRILVLLSISTSVNFFKHVPPSRFIQNIRWLYKTFFFIHIYPLIYSRIIALIWVTNTRNDVIDFKYFKK